MAIGDGYDIEVARQPTLLKSIVQEVRLRAESLLGKLSSRKTVLPYNDRHAELTRDEQRLVAELFCRTVWMDQTHTLGFPPVAARQHVEGDPALLEQFTQHDEERCFTSTAG